MPSWSSSATASSGAGLEPFAGAAVIADMKKNFCVPDQVSARPDNLTEDGLTGAELVVEVRWPGRRELREAAVLRPSGVWALSPARVLAWTDLTADATRFVFP